MWVVEARTISIVMSPSPLPALDSMRGSKGPRSTEPFSTMHKRKQFYKPDLLWATTIVTPKRLLDCGVHLCQALSLMVQCASFLPNLLQDAQQSNLFQECIFQTAHNLQNADAELQRVRHSILDGGKGA